MGQRNTTKNITTNPARKKRQAKTNEKITEPRERPTTLNIKLQPKQSGKWDKKTRERAETATTHKRTSRRNRNNDNAQGAHHKVNTPSDNTTKQTDARPQAKAAKEIEDPGKKKQRKKAPG
ncbi:hypothetical protein [Paenibacillus algorifonticola]|uniref:hypothetical protein n=1 Tax=Paenibacillus algorifonticola TaxID=684063 RepID=UPI000941DA6D|nr:hypothetical protein [Paenibacillus algorifonticola]